MYYEIIDPGTFSLTILMSLGRFIQLLATSQDYAHKTEFTILSGLIVLYSILFLVFNFRKSYQKQLSKGKRPQDMSLFTFLYAFASFCASISLISFGAFLIYYAYKNDVQRDNSDKTYDKLSSTNQMFFYINGILVIMCGFIGFIRLPIQYLLAAIGVNWLLSFLF